MNCFHADSIPKNTVFLIVSTPLPLSKHKIYSTDSIR